MTTIRNCVLRLFECLHGLTTRMRAKPTDVTGNVGETEVAAKFERLGWGVAPNPKHDLGTDLWLMARDKRLFDLGLVIGAQVKGGPTWFKKKAFDDAKALRGWWFSERNREHFDAWLNHALPHLVVLYDLDKQVAYWAHVTDDAVVGTGKGAKILVPVSNTVDEEHREELLRVAASKKGGGAWEGSAWTGASAILPSALLRHALIAPRLIAPHPNAGLGAVTPAQAVALLIQARIADFDSRSETHETVPSLNEAVTSKDWDWRFVGAIGKRVTSGDSWALRAAAADAPDPARRSAAAVAAAATLLEDSLADEALEILDAALEDDAAGPVDHAWLIVQKARACVEIGRVDEARELAAQVQAAGASHADDVTATALAGVAALILFNTASFDQRDVSAVIAGADTTTAWWRTQTLSRGLTALTERTFLAWSRDTTIRFSVGDAANDQLLSAALTASYLGDHATWRHLSGLLAQDGLIRLGRDASVETAVDLLQTMRFAGDKDNIKHAVRRLVDDGPAVAITRIASAIDLNRLTNSTASPTLELFQRGGDLLDATASKTVVHWILGTLADPRAFVGRTRPSYLLHIRLIDTLAGVVPAATLDVQREIAAHVAELPPQADQALATSWARVAGALDKDAWSSAVARRVGVAADGHHWSLRMPLLGIAAPHDDGVRQSLLDAASGGDLNALEALGDVRRLPDDVVRVLVDALSSHVANRIEQARRGVFGMGGHDHGEALVLLNVWHPGLAAWDPLVNLISSPGAAGAHKRGAVVRLAAFAERLPTNARDALLAAARTAAGQPASPRRLPGEQDVAGPIAELVAALATEGSPPVPLQLPALLGGDSDARRSAARIATRMRNPQGIGVLFVLASDDDPYVRAVAAQGLASLAAKGHTDDVAIAAVQETAADPGRVVPAAVAVALADNDLEHPDLASLLVKLRDHPSARVRRAARS